MRQKVIVVGGGIAGLTAAHELIERDFQVEVYERRSAFGGKAASVRGTDPGSFNFERPGEHGFRFFPGWYRHVPDTLARIPFRSGGSHGPNATVADHLVPCDENVSYRYEGATVPIALRPPKTVDQVQALMSFFVRLQEMGLPRADALFFFQTLAEFLRTPELERRRKYDAMSWWSLVDAPNRSAAFREITVATTRGLLAAKPKEASAYTIATCAVRTLFDSPLRSDHVLDGPTSETWIDPWVRYLKGRGVTFHLDCELESVVFDGKKRTIDKLTFSSVQASIRARALRARIRGDRIPKLEGVPNTPETASEALERELPVEPIDGKADYYVFALPVEQMAYYVNRSPMIQRFDPALTGIVSLAGSVEWMAGIQFYLQAPIGLPPGHAVLIDTEWALTAIESTRFWRDVKLPGQVSAILSVDISAWNAPGRFNQKEAYRCTRDEIAREVWEQLKASMNRAGRQPILPETLLVGPLEKSYFLDDNVVDLLDRKKQAAYNRAQAVRFSADVLLNGLPAVEADAFAFGDRDLVNLEPLLINRPGSLALRPEAASAIPNMFLAGDYVNTATNLASMESANEAARHAVNAIIDVSGAHVPRCTTWQFEDRDFVGKIAAWAGNVEDVPGVRKTFDLAMGAADSLTAVVGRAGDRFKQLWKRP